MALPAHVLDKIPAELKKNALLRIPEPSDAGPERTFPDGVRLEQQLEQGQLLQGAVVELCISGGAAWGTTFALRACRAAQTRAKRETGQPAWCAFIDPSDSLYAPGIHALGIDLSRLLVVRPDEDSLSRVALRLVESQVFPVVVIDTMGIPGSSLDVSLSRWVRVVRRLSLAVASTESTVVLLTNRTARRPLHLPVAARFEISRSNHRELTVSVPKSPVGPWGGPVRIRADRGELRHAG